MRYFTGAHKGGAKHLSSAQENENQTLHIGPQANQTALHVSDARMGDRTTLMCFFLDRYSSHVESHITVLKVLAHHHLKLISVCLPCLLRAIARSGKAGFPPPFFFTLTRSRRLEPLASPPLQIPFPYRNDSNHRSISNNGSYTNIHECSIKQVKNINF